MNKRKRSWALSFLLLAIIGILFLSSGLADVALSTQWGVPDFGSGAGRSGAVNPGESILERLPTISESLLRMVFMLTILIVPTALFFALFSAEVRRAFLDELKKMIPIVVWMVTLLYLLQRLRLNRSSAPSPSLSAGSEGPPDWITNPTALTAFLIGVIILTLVTGIGWYLWRRTRSRGIDLIAWEAQTTINEVQAGHNLKSAIIECYYRMCRVLSEQQRIERAKSMTPREFASRLELMGIGGREAQRLTGLFEAVRYGERSFGEAEEREAVECLTAVTRQARIGNR